ncbi:DinB family protein [Antarcticibacterium arcticum]|uniref:DinB family protein n=1 Tax=Antarcticibacterium arcticum TaxID=2585771 RepID=A0A5B8YI75_9FLAO|nr:DinB family protein [Antarcticibacterium arcticum]QED37524.1 DinB family protein [Antarcticibacterium arcticum]
MEGSAQIKLQLISHLKGGEAFMPVEELLKEITFEKLGLRPKDLPYSFYELFYHIRFTQKDILDYCTSREYKEHSWPADYWPQEKSPVNSIAWEKLKEDYFRERQLLIDHLLAPHTELLGMVGNNTAHSLLREVLLVIEHTAYHSGQMLIVLRYLGLHNPD